MGFEKIHPLEKAQTYLNIAFHKAVKKVKQKKLSRRAGSFDKIKTIESSKITIAKDILYAKLDKILQEFPKTEDLNPYYLELVKISVGEHELKTALSKVSFALNKINDIARIYLKRVLHAKTLAEINTNKNQFYARTSSVMRGINDALIFLIQARTTLQSFPTIKESLPKVAIAGFPNVGKSTLMSKLSTAKPEIAAYAFTTKSIMVGYIEKDKKKIIQLLDTPGTLNRKDKMNTVEMQAYLAMEMVTDEIVYIFDLTESYPIEDQILLYERVKELGKPVTIYLSKTDILDKKIVKDFKARKKFDVIAILDDAEQLKKELIERLHKPAPPAVAEADESSEETETEPQEEQEEE